MQILTSCRLCNHKRLNVITKQEQKRSECRLWASPLTAGFMFLETKQAHSIHGGQLEAAMCPDACRLLQKVPATIINSGRGLVWPLCALSPRRL